MCTQLLAIRVVIPRNVIVTEAVLIVAVNHDKVVNIDSNVVLGVYIIVMIIVLITVLIVIIMKL